MQAAALAVVLAFGFGCNKQQAAVPRTDQQVANDIQAKIAGESALSGQNIRVAVQNGTVTLSGTANDDASRALAGNEAGAVDGVKTVVNNLAVQPPRQAAAAGPPADAQPAPAAAPVRSRERPESRRREGHVHSAAASIPAPAPAPAPAPMPDQVRTVPPPPPAAPPEPVSRTVTIPEGTVVPVRINELLDSATAQPNQTFRGSLAGDLIADGMVAVPQGTSVVGRVVDAKDAGRFKGSALLSIELTQINTRGQQVPMVTNAFVKQGSGRGKNTAEKAGGGAALGAIIGALAGGGKGAAIGAVTGGGIGAGVNGVTRGQQVQIQPETLVNFKLQSPISVTTKTKAAGPRVYDDNSPELQQRPQ